MVRRQFYINGKPSSDFGIYAASDTYLNAPAVGYDSFSVPKVNGLFISEKDRLSNVTRRFTCFAPGGIKTACEALFQYLYSIDGYFILQSDYDPEHYCYAYFDEGVEVTPFRTKAGTFDLYFSCMPQKYIGNGVVDGYKGGEGNNLLDAEGLIGFSAYKTVRDNVPYFAIYDNRSGITPYKTHEARVYLPAGQYVLTAKEKDFINSMPTLYVYYTGGTSDSFSNVGAGTNLKYNIDTNGKKPVLLQFWATEPGRLYEIMLQADTGTLEPYEPYSTYPPVAKSIYSLSYNSVNILPTFAIEGLQEAIDKNPNAFPNSRFWITFMTSVTNVSINAEDKDAVFFAKVNGGTLTTDYSPVGFTYALTDTVKVCEYFVGTFIETAGGQTFTYDMYEKDVSNSNATGGDAKYCIMADFYNVSNNGKHVVSIVLNGESMVFVDIYALSLLVGTDGCVVEVDSKTYEATAITKDFKPVQVNSCVTIIGDISLKSSNKVTWNNSTTSTYYAWMEVEWWTV